MVGTVAASQKKIWAKITSLKSAGMLFLKYCAKRYGSGLSKELLYIIIVQGAAKVWPVNVGGPKKVDLPRYDSSQAIYLIKLALNPKCQTFLQTSNFDMS